MSEAKTSNLVSNLRDLSNRLRDSGRYAADECDLAGASLIDEAIAALTVETRAESLVDWKASHELAVEQRGRLARYILMHLSGDRRVKDHACAQCAPESEIITPGFVCAYHLAQGIVNGFPLKTSSEGPL